MIDVWVLDATAAPALFAAQPIIYDLLIDAPAGRAAVILPCTAIAEAEASGRYGTAWQAIFATKGVDDSPLQRETAVQVGQLSGGGLLARHAACEAAATRGTVVTGRPELYAGLDVPILVI
jgi:hypothetical protein